MNDTTRVSTWAELIASGIPVSGRELTQAQQYIVIERAPDGLLRAHDGIQIWSYPHRGPYLTAAGELVVIATEGDLKMLEGVPVYVELYDTNPHARTAKDLGLAGNHVDPTVHSVLIELGDIEKLNLVHRPKPLDAWEREMLEGDPSELDGVPLQPR